MIMGGGMIGRFVAETLAQQARIKVIERDGNHAERLAATLRGVLVLNGDGTDPELLQAEDLEHMDSFVAVTGDDENNIITTLLAKTQASRGPLPW